MAGFVVWVWPEKSALEIGAVIEENNEMKSVQTLEKSERMKHAWSGEVDSWQKQKQKTKKKTSPQQ